MPPGLSWQIQLLLFLLKWVSGPLVAVGVTVMFADPLRELLSPILMNFGVKKRPDVTGTWKATFYFGSPELPFEEMIVLKRRFGLVVGHIIPDPANYSALHRVDQKKPLRVRAVLRDNRFLGGAWFHPVQISHHSGMFELLLNQNNDQLTGRWLGIAERSSRIETGRWDWKRMT